MYFPQDNRMCFLDIPCVECIHMQYFREACSRFVFNRHRHKPSVPKKCVHRFSRGRVLVGAIGLCALKGDEFSFYVSSRVL